MYMTQHRIYGGDIYFSGSVRRAALGKMHVLYIVKKLSNFKDVHVFEEMDVRVPQQRRRGAGVCL